MKKYIFILFATVTVIACTSKVAPTANSSNTTIAKTETASSISAEDTKAAITAGHTIYTTKCSKCHEAKDVTAFNKTSWEGILKDMIPKARLNETDAKNVTAYVMANAKK